MEKISTLRLALLEARTAILVDLHHHYFVIVSIKKTYTRKQSVLVLLGESALDVYLAIKVGYNMLMKTIKLTNTKDIVLVDDEDYPVLSRLNWYLSDTGYAITDTPVKHLKMHKLLVGAIGKKVIDHTDRNKLNNQKDNLRIVSQSVNVRNSYRYENSKHYYFSKKRGWIIDSSVLGVRYLHVDNTMIAERVVKRLKLGFPKDVAVLEAKKPTISISNWSKFNIKYDDYLESLRIDRPIKEVLRRKISRRGKGVR